MSIVVRKQRQTPYARSSSLWPADICERLYNRIKLERTNKGKPTPMRSACRILTETDKPIEPGKKHSRFIFKENACFCVDIINDGSNDTLKSWFEYKGSEEIHGEKKIKHIALTDFSTVFLVDEKSSLNISPTRIRRAIGVGSLLTLLSRIKWIEKGTELLSFADWMPGASEFAVILDVSAAVLAAKRSHVVMETHEGVWFVVDMPQYTYHLMDALLRCPDWKCTAPDFLEHASA